MADKIFPRLLKTILYLRSCQVCFQVRNRFVRPSFRYLTCRLRCSGLCVYDSLKTYRILSGSTFTFLNIPSQFISWNDTAKGMLWAYNLNYMDWLLQEDMTFDEGALWIDRFIADLPDNHIGLAPYPTALRGINWIKFISRHYDKIDEERLSVWNDSLYSQYVHLSRNLEYHLLGNHLLEDAYSLFIASIYFSDSKLYKKASKLLRKQLCEQILPDGAHFEQSPMYHCILLDRLLDCCNFSFNNIRHEGQEKMNVFLKDMAVKMLGHLEAILYSDKSFPLFNDSAVGISPEPMQIFSYAQRLGMIWEKISMNEVGYRYMCNENMEVFADVGNVMASYQPGHTHADTFSYELRIKGMPFIVDTGISTYDKNARRQYERGTSAHNTVQVDGKDSSLVWGGFRVGSRAKVSIITDTDTELKAVHYGYGRSKPHSRTFVIDEDCLHITDELPHALPAVNYIHLAHDVNVNEVLSNVISTDLADISFDGATRIELADEFFSEEYNVWKQSKTIVVHFVGKMNYCIKSKKL